MGNKTVSFRLPNEVVKAIEDHAKATGQTKTAIVAAALARTLGAPRGASDFPLQQRVNMLEQRITALEQEPAQPSSEVKKRLSVSAQLEG